MNQILPMLLTNWSFVRWFRVLLGVFIGYQAFALQDMLGGFIAAFLLFQAATNTGCGLGGCAVNTSPVTKDEPQSLKFEEIASNPKLALKS